VVYLEFHRTLGLCGGTSHTSFRRGKKMDAPGDLWASLYFVPVIGVFALAGAVYYLSFRSKGDEDNQSLRIYLNVLSGDDDRNRKAAKKFRKFGTLANGGAKVGTLVFVFLPQFVMEQSLLTIHCCGKDRTARFHRGNCD
jgi:hypothetical protein